MKRQWETEELIEHWILGPWDLAQVGNKTGASRLGFAVLLKFFQREGRFPFFKNEIPGMVISFVATQIDVEPSAYLQYAWTGRTIEYHRALIRKSLGFKESSQEDAEQMLSFRIAEILPQEHQEERLREQTYQWFKRQHLEAPTPDRLTRLIRSALHTFEQQLYDATLARLPEKTQAALEALLQTEIVAPQVPDTQEQAPLHPQETRAQATSTLQQLRMDPGRVGLATMLEEMAKLRRIRELGLPDDLFPGLARKVLSVYRNRASVEEPSRLHAHAPAKRLTLLSALCVMRAQEITDGLVDLLIHIVHKIDVRAEKRVEQEYVNEFQRVANKEGILYRIAEAAVEHPDEQVRKVVFPVASEKLLRDVIKEHKAKSPAFRQQVHTIMRSSYSHHYRRMVPELLDILEFRSNNELYRPVIRAILLVKDYVRSPRQYYPDHESIPLQEVVAAKWREFVVEKHAVPRKEVRLPEIPTEDDICRFYQAVWNCLNFADMVLIKTLFYTGVRVSELVSIRLHEVDVERCQVRITQGKGSKDRQVPFPRSFRELLALHMEQMHTRGAIYLFESVRKHKYTDRGVRKMLARYAASAGITRSMSPHKWRHFLFTWLKKEGIDDALIQPYSGHATRQSLEIYSRLSLTDAQPSYNQAMERFPIQ